MAKTTTQATEFANLTEAQAVAKAGPIFTEEQKSSGILASVLMAQFILESGYGKSELALNANNYFGMKTSLSGNTWAGSTWDETQEYVKETKEQQEDGAEYTVTAKFRKYGCIEDSIADHSAYLLGAMNGEAKRYEGLNAETDYREAAQIIKDGGYATDVDYVEKLCGIIEKWNLTQYDVKEDTADYPEKLTSGYYRVRSAWTDKAGQLGAYRKLSNAKEKADENPGYYVFSNDGVKIYPVEKKAEAVDTDTDSDTETDGDAENGNTDTPAEDTEQDENTDSEDTEADISETDEPPGKPVLYGKLKTLMNIRKGNSISTDVVTTYKKNTVIEILEVCKNGWYKIKCAESDSGFAYVSNEDGLYAYTGKGIYTVRREDTLWKIAKEKLGDSKRNGEIKAANGLTSTVIKVGMELLIP